MLAQIKPNVLKRDDGSIGTAKIVGKKISLRQKGKGRSDENIGNFIRQLTDKSKSYETETDETHTEDAEFASDGPAGLNQIFSVGQPHAHSTLPTGDAGLVAKRPSNFMVTANAGSKSGFAPSRDPEPSFFGKQVQKIFDSYKNVAEPENPVVISGKSPKEELSWDMRKTIHAPKKNTP